MSIYVFLTIIGIIMMVMSIILIISFINSEDPKKQGIAWSCIFGAGIGFCIIIESVSRIINI